ncbi:MAG: ROK family transcriptional regulator [Oscillospiraceae bacterium]|nr:ROK family transcriptional regulator [Oscillospiraceae bacterium]
MRLHSTSEIRRQNAFHIVREVIDHPDNTVSDISRKYGISVATVSSIISILRNDGLLVLSGEKASTGGRKALLYSINPEYAYFVGISITVHTVKSVLIRMDGLVLKQTFLYRTFEDTKEYCDFIYDLYLRTAEGVKEPSAVVLSFPGRFDKDTSVITRDDGFVVDVFNIEKILFCFRDVKGFSVCDASKFSALPMLQTNPDLNDCVFVSINRAISGTIIRDGHLFPLSKSDCNFGKMIVGAESCPDKKPAFRSFAACCSASHIVDTLKSLGLENIVMENAGDPGVSRYSGFFREIREGNRMFQRLWDVYLFNLAAGLNNIYAMFGLPIVISGDMANKISGFSDELHAHLSALNADITRDSISFSETGLFDDPIGAALKARYDLLEELVLQASNRRSAEE